MTVTCSSVSTRLKPPCTTIPSIFEIRMTEGPQAVYGNITISGKKTKDYVIRRELRTIPGESSVALISSVPNANWASSASSTRKDQPECGAQCRQQRYGRHQLGHRRKSGDQLGIVCGFWRRYRSYRYAGCFLQQLLRLKYYL